MALEVAAPILLDLADIIVLNETEVGSLTSSDLSDSDSPSKFVKLLRKLRRSKDQILCVTLGRRGAIALVDDEAMSIEGRVVTPIDTTGAGDCFVGALAARLAGGANISDALGYANFAASICVQRMGAGPSMPTADEVQAVWATTLT